MKETIEKNVITSKQETTNMENNDTIAEKWNTAINSAVDAVKLSIETAINTAIEQLGKSPVMVKLETEINELETAKNGQTETIINAIETAINAKNNELETAKKSMYNDVYGGIISAITGKKSVKSNNGNNEKTDNGNNYTYNDAIAEALAGGKSLKAGDICKAIEKQNKLQSIHTNDGWRRVVSSALLNTKKYSRNDNHEYSLLG